jgi:FlaA1/EpsC-like NDP-sugar epimerase
MTQSINHGGGSKSDPELNFGPHSWHALLRREARSPVDLKSSEYRDVLNRRCVLVTGAGGWIGSRLVKRLAESGARKLVLLDSSEGALYEIDQALLADSGIVERIAVLASICDAVAVDEVFERHRPDIIYHAGALKHVPLMESNPFAVVETNTLGTSVLTQAARRYDCEQMVMVSTDKAVDPASIMGASKRMAELVILGMGSRTLRTQAVRLGNVLGSSGSVVPLFLQQIASGRPVTVSHPEARRFFMTASDAVEALLEALSPRCPEGLLVAEMGDPIRIVDLVDFLITRSSNLLAEHALAGQQKLKEPSIAFTALRPGDKMEESLISRHEAYTGETKGPLREVVTPVPTRDDLEDGITALALAVQRRNLADLLQAVLQLVPEYRPSSLILEQVRVASRVEMVR